MVHPEVRRQTQVHDDLRERGFTLEETEYGTIARGQTHAAVSLEAPLFVTEPRDQQPLTIVSTIAAAARDGYIPLLIADNWSAPSITALLSEPFLLESHTSGRRFHAIEDRIQLTDDTYACVRSGALTWAEQATTSDRPPVELYRDDQVVAVLDSVETLTCPGPAPEAFPYRYTREPAGQFRVLDRDGVVSTYPSMTALKADFQPAPLPLVPEHHIRTCGRHARATVLAVVDNGVTYRTV